MLIIFFALPGLAVPLVIGMRLLRRYEREPLQLMATWFAFKPVVATLLAGLLLHLLPWLGELSGVTVLSDAALLAPALAGIGITLTLLWIFRAHLPAHTLLVTVLLVGDGARWLSATAALNGSGFSPTYGATLSPIYPLALALPALYAVGVWLYLEQATLPRPEG